MLERPPGRALQSVSPGSIEGGGSLLITYDAKRGAEREYLPDEYQGFEVNDPSRPRPEQYLLRSP